MDKLLKGIEIYKKRYSNQVGQLLKFVREKVQINSQSYNKLQNLLLSHKKINQKLNDQEIKMYFHLIAALCKNVDIKHINPNKLTQYVQIQYKSKKQGVKNQPNIEKNQKINENIIKNEEQKQKIHKKRSSKQQKKQQKQHLATIEQNVYAQNNQLSSYNGQIYPSLSSNQHQYIKNQQIPMMKSEQLQINNTVTITGYDKAGQSFLNPIIKYRIIFSEKQVFRRYTQFQNLMKYINKEYQGHILPQIPPKQGIKYNFSYFRGVDQAFLNQRQIKLEQMLNTLLSNYEISKDQKLLKFLTIQDFQFDQQQSKALYLKALDEIGFSAKDIKDYGIAYYNFIKNFNRDELKSSIIQKYNESQQLFRCMIQFDNYRNKINNNFDNRRKIFEIFCNKQQNRKLVVTNFDKNISKLSYEISNLQKEYNKYIGLKQQHEWFKQLKLQKEASQNKENEQLKIKQIEITNRIIKMQKNLLISIEQLLKKNNEYLTKIQQQMIEWRLKIHP